MKRTPSGPRHRRFRTKTGPAASLAVLSTVATLVATLLLSVSCAVRQPTRTALREECCPAKTLALLEKNSGALQSVKGTLRVHLSMEEPGFGGRVQAGLVAQRPDKVRLRAYAGFSNLIDVAVDGDSLWALLPSTSTLLIGLVEETAVPLASGLLVAALREALFPGEFCVAECTVEMEGDGVCRLEEEFDGGKRISLVDVASGRLRRMDILDSEGDERVTVSYRDYRRSGRTRFPHDIAILFSSMGVSMRLLFDRVQLNSRIDEDVFKLKVPPGTIVKRLDELDGMEGGEELKRGQDLMK